MKLKDKIVLVTGSSSGIGEATAKLFAQEGASVIINCKTDVEGANRVVDEIKTNGGRALLIQADVSNEKDVHAMFQKVIDEFGTLDILINNAGAAGKKKFLEATYTDWLNDFNNNLFGTVLCSKEAAHIMLKSKSGVILNTSSIRGTLHTGREGIMPYSAAKAALNSFTKTLAKELAPHINVNAVAPGFVKTPPYDNVSQEMKDGFISRTYLKRWIQPTEIAEAFLYLATAKAITGEILVVDGGFTLKDG